MKLKVIFLTLQSQALLVLPFFTTLPEEPLAELQKALDALVASHFPMQSDEFAKGSLHRNNYMDCIRKVKSVFWRLRRITQIKGKKLIWSFFAFFFLF